MYGAVREYEDPYWGLCKGCCEKHSHGDSVCKREGELCQSRGSCAGTHFLDSFILSPHPRPCIHAHHSLVALTEA